jgi:hypothetical protein
MQPNPAMDDIAPIQLTTPVTRGSTLGHFRKENVMSNFVYAITLAGFGVMQLAIVLIEFVRV